MLYCKHWDMQGCKGIDRSGSFVDKTMACHAMYIYPRHRHCFFGIALFLSSGERAWSLWSSPIRRVSSHRVDYGSGVWWQTGVPLSPLPWNPIFATMRNLTGRAKKGQGDVRHTQLNRLSNSHPWFCPITIQRQTLFYFSLPCLPFFLHFFHHHIPSRLTLPHSHHHHHEVLLCCPRRCPPPRQPGHGLRCPHCP